LEQETSVVDSKTMTMNENVGWHRDNRSARGTAFCRMIRNLFIASVALLLATGCAATYEKRKVTSQRAQLAVSAGEVAEKDLLGIRIHSFRSGTLPQGAKARGMSVEIRKAEGYYTAVKLKDTLQRSGHWGPVRVVPANSNDGEVVVNGEILESDGELLKLLVSIRDATGMKWFSKEYAGVVNTETFNRTPQGGEAFQFVYNQISNDIVAYRGKLAAGETTSIRQVAELKFAGDFAPSIFSRYLTTAKQASSEAPSVFGNLFESTPSNDAAVDGQRRFALARLPSEDDPNYQRVQRIRAREHQLIDTLDQHYEGLAKNISDAYTQWRLSRLTEVNAVREIERLENERTTNAVLGGIAGVGLIILGSQTNSCAGCGTAGAVIGGTVLAASLKAAIEANTQAAADMEIHTRALEELGQSLAAEVKPVVVEVEGSTVELKGSADAKFQQWRTVMKKLHEREVGPIEAAPPPGPTPSSDRGPTS
jgi:transcription termination factor NusB